jgi:hypothetical protein
MTNTAIHFQNIAKKKGNNQPLQGPAVRHLRAAFLGNWFDTGAPLLDLESHVTGHTHAESAAVPVVRSTSSVGWNDTATLLQVLVAYAQKRIWVATGACFTKPPLICANRRWP